MLLQWTSTMPCCSASCLQNSSFLQLQYIYKGYSLYTKVWESHRVAKEEAASLLVSAVFDHCQAFQVYGWSTSLEAGDWAEARVRTLPWACSGHMTSRRIDVSATPTVGVAEPERDAPERQEHDAQAPSGSGSLHDATFNTKKFVTGANGQKEQPPLLSAQIWMSCHACRAGPGRCRCSDRLRLAWAPNQS